MLPLSFYISLLDTPEEKEKFEQIYIKYADIMHKVAYSILKDEHEAENVLHDAFIDVMTYLHKINNIETHKRHPYILAIIETRCYKVLKKRSKVMMEPIEHAEHLTGETDTYINLVEDQEVFRQLVEIVHELEYPYKDILYLKYLSKMKSTEIAEILDMKADNVRWHLMQAKRRISQTMKNRGIEI